MDRLSVVLKLWPWLPLGFLVGALVFAGLTGLFFLELSLPGPDSDSGAWLEAFILMAVCLLAWLVLLFFLLRSYFRMLDKAMQSTSLPRLSLLEKPGLGVVMAAAYYGGIPLDMALFNWLVPYLSLA
jgi:hypothetical protein